MLHLEGEVTEGSLQQPLPAESWLWRTWLPLTACAACENNACTRVLNALGSCVKVFQNIKRPKKDVPIAASDSRGVLYLL